MQQVDHEYHSEKEKSLKSYSQMTSEDIDSQLSLLADTHELNQWVEDVACEKRDPSR